MARTAFLVGMLRRARGRPGVVGEACAAASFHLCRALAASGRPIIRGRIMTGSPIVLDVRDPAHREILWTGQTEAGTAAVFSHLATAGWTVVDVGANAGFYSMLAWDLGQRRGRVLAFEPNPRMARLLRRSAQDAGAAGIEVIDAACGSTAGRTTLYLSGNPGQAAFATIRPDMRWTDDWRALAVSVTTVDRECDVRGLVPDLIKIDAEGAEHEVIAGMSQLVTGRVPSYILCEVAVGWERPDPRPWIDILCASGYKPHVVGDGGVLRALGALTSETVQNVCFIRSGAKARFERVSEARDLRDRSIVR